MSVGDVLSEAFSLYGRFFWRLVGTAAIVFVVLDLIAALLFQIGKGSAAGTAFLGLISLIVTLVGSFWVQGALVEAVQDVRDGKIDATIGELYARVSPRLPALIAAGILAGLGIGIGILAGLGIGIGFILLIAPGLFLLTRWSLIVPAIVLERLRAGDSFGRSNELVKGASWPVLGVIVVSGIIAWIASAIISAVFRGIFSSFLGYWFGGLVAHSLIVPFVAAAWTLMYFKRVESGTPPPAEPAATA